MCEGRKEGDWRNGVRRDRGKTKSPEEQKMGIPYSSRADWGK